jgi:hypothetical protein
MTPEKDMPDTRHAAATNPNAAPNANANADSAACHVRAVSGLGAKSPAAFLVEVRGKRLLMDLGAGPEA